MTSLSRSGRLVARAVVAAIACLHVGCATDDDFDFDDGGYGEVTSAATVGSYQTSTCSTSVVLGLSKQIADEVGCMNPTSLVRFQPSTRLQITSNAVLPYLSQRAKDDLVKVTETVTVRVNSAFRTVAQQYLLYRWFQLGRCGITAAATPGRSNHESGRALDVANYSQVITPMANRGWSHSVPGDPVHFDHLASPDIRGRDTLAFQRLWNRNKPADKIAEDGIYGPQTEARLRSSEATGFPVGATCAPRVVGADVVMIEGPDKVAPGARAHFAITVVNTGATDWPAATQLVVAGGASSELFDPQSWASASVVGEIGVAVPAGEQGVLELEALAPEVAEETGFFTQLALTSGTDMFGLINLALTVTPNGDEGTSGDNGDGHDDGHDDDGTAATTGGGCSTGSGAGWGALAFAALVLRLRRRRR